MDKLTHYMSIFFSKGIQILCSDHPSSSHYSKSVAFEKSFICGSFWSVSGLSVSSSTISEEDMVKMLKKLKMCMRELPLLEKESRYTDIGPVKAFGQYVNSQLYDCNIQSTLYAIQIYYMVKTVPEFKEYALDDFLIGDSELEAVLNFIRLLWDNKTGCFYNSLPVSVYSYTDLRHTMSALCAFNLCCKLLNMTDDEIFEKLNRSFDLNLLFKFLKSHFNSDGGVSLVPRSQSHVAGAFCCLGSLAFIGRLNSISYTRMSLLVTWLLERISVSGGINGRVGKSNDVCYIWWNLASLSLIRHYYAKPIKLLDDNVLSSILEFLESSQNPDGGFSSNKSHSSSDPYHSFTAILSLSLINELLNFSNIRPIEPLYATPRLL